MNRRKFFRNGGLLGLGAMVIRPDILLGNTVPEKDKFINSGKSAKNIIFLVSDGMSMGTLTMCDLMMQRKIGKGSRWMQLYRDGLAKRALMDTASADSLVTDSAAAGSAWGGGVRVENGKLNYGTNGEEYEPILTKFKKAGKSVGCVTTVPITHATPASFCVSMKHRKLQPEIAEKYLDLKFDVMMGGGLEHFTKEGRADGKDVLDAFKTSGFDIALSKSDMITSANSKSPFLGLFHENGLPYSVDQNSDKQLQQKVPTLAEMTQFAINRMKNNENGFVMQIEGGKVDWAAHGNDSAALLNDQMAFDDAVGVALDFAEKNDDTLVIITTDHGNSNPGLILGENTNQDFDKFCTAKYSNEWILKDISANTSVKQIIERIEFASTCKISEDQAKSLLVHFEKLDVSGNYNPYQLPFQELAQIQRNYSGIGWAGKTHTADFVELAMFGAGSEGLPPLVLNTDLHQYMLKAANIEG